MTEDQHKSLSNHLSFEDSEFAIKYNDLSTSEKRQRIQYLW